MNCLNPQMRTGFDKFATTDRRVHRIAGEVKRDASYNFSTRVNYTGDARKDEFLQVILAQRSFSLTVSVSW